jgi:hypothetical protein
MGKGRANHNRCVAGVRAIFGQDCQVTVKPVREMPREPSGKFRFYRAARPEPIDHRT